MAFVCMATRVGMMMRNAVECCVVWTGYGRIDAYGSDNVRHQIHWKAGSNGQGQYPQPSAYQ